MSRPKVAVVRYERPLESVKKAVELSGGLAGLSAGAGVFVKPNIVFWTRAVPFPKWGVVTTSRVVEDMVVLLKEHGVEHITIGEGSVLFDPKDTETPAHAFEALGYNLLKKRYGVHVINVHERPFERVDLGDDIRLNFNVDFLNTDYLVNIPVLKTHAQTVVSLGIKNLKGLIDVNSRKICHSADPAKDLNYMVSRLALNLPPSFTILDGIFTNERGPAFDGKIRRSDLLVASSDMLSADKVGARILGYNPSEVPHLVHAASAARRTVDLTDLDVLGENVQEIGLNLKYEFPYNETGTLPVPMEKMGIKGLSYRKYDLTMCTYCSALTGIILTSIAFAWKGRPWDDVEVLTGKVMKPDPGRKRTILIGKCLYEAYKGHPNAQDFTWVKTCPPSTEAVVKALHDAGIEVNPQIFQNLDLAPGFFMNRYQGKPEFDESLFQIQ